MRNYISIFLAWLFCLSACKKTQDIHSPQIISISPGQGPVKSFVYITGLYFDSVATAVTVTFNGVQATIASINDSAITVIVPNNATTGKITITVQGRTTTSMQDFVILDLPGAWLQKANMIRGNTYIGTAYCCGAGFDIGSYGYVCLGYNGGGGTNQLFQYDPGSDTWTQMANAPVSRYLPNWFVINNIAYVGLGVNDQQDSTSKNIYAYDPSTNTWSQKSSFPGIVLNGNANFAIGNKGYLVGFPSGSSGPSSAQVWEYDQNADGWTQKNNFPGSYLDPIVAFSIDSLAFLCGWTKDQNQTGECWQYYPSTDSWLQKNTFPGTYTYPPVAITINKHGYVMGGDNWQYDPASDTWARMAFFTFFRNGGYGFTIDNRGYFAAGQGDYGFDCFACSDLWQFTPPN